MSFIRRTDYYASTSIYALARAETVSMIMSINLNHMKSTSSYSDRTVRIVITPAVIAVFGFLCVRFYHFAGYLKPIGECYESIALIAFYYLLFIYVTPVENRGVHPFSNLKHLKMRQAYYVGHFHRSLLCKKRGNAN